MNPWPQVTVVGAGAVGCFFGGMLARAGAPVTLIGRAQHVDVWNRDGLTIDSAQFPAKVAVRGATTLDAVADARLVLVCVKTLDLEATARDLAPLLSKDATVLCMQNGVDHAERFRAATAAAGGTAGLNAIPAAVYVAASLPEPGHVRHDGRGDLVIGNAPAADLQLVADVFTRAEVPCRISTNIAGELFVKLIMNCAYNAQSAICQANYGSIVGNRLTRAVLIDTVYECMAVAEALGLMLPVADPVNAALELGANTMPQQFSSTAQDIARGKLTEIDSLNGYIAARGGQLGVPTPVNSTLHALVKLIEAKPRERP
jgi:2-dehydropantoate 2-reductase